MPRYNYPSHTYRNYYNSYQQPQQDSSISPIIIIILIICCCCFSGSLSLLPFIGSHINLSKESSVYYYEKLSTVSGNQKQISVINISGNNVTINTVLIVGIWNKDKTLLTVNTLLGIPQSPPTSMKLIMNKNNTITLGSLDGSPDTTAIVSNVHPDLIGTWINSNFSLTFNNDMTITGTLNGTKLKYPYYFSLINIYDSSGNFYSSYSLSSDKKILTLKDVGINLSK